MKTLIGVVIGFTLALALLGVPKIKLHEQQVKADTPSPAPTTDPRFQKWTVLYEQHPCEIPSQTYRTWLIPADVTPYVAIQAQTLGKFSWTHYDPATMVQTVTQQPAVKYFPPKETPEELAEKH